MHHVDSCSLLLKFLLIGQSWLWIACVDVDQEEERLSYRHGEAGVTAFDRETWDTTGEFEKAKHGEDKSTDGGVPPQFQTQFQQYEHVGNCTQIHSNGEVHWYYSDTRDQSYQKHFLSFAPGHGRDEAHEGFNIEE